MTDNGGGGFIAHHVSTANMVVSVRELLDRYVSLVCVYIDSLYLGYPHWDMNPELKCYYLMQSAHWCQELLVLLLKLEKPRKDYAELVAHHIVTLWLIGFVHLHRRCDLFS